MIYFVLQLFFINNQKIKQLPQKWSIAIAKQS